MEIFYTPEDVEKEYGIETKILANWRANLIGPDCFKWKDKILYHSQEIDEWFEPQDFDAEPETEEISKPEKAMETKSRSRKKIQRAIIKGLEAHQILINVGHKPVEKAQVEKISVWKG